MLKQNNRASTMRTSEAERQRVADFLRDCCAEGRLGADELDHRLDRLFAGHTVADLETLVWDLPGGEAVVPRLWPMVRSSQAVAARRGRTAHAPRTVVALAILGVAVLAAASLPPEAVVGLTALAAVLLVVSAVLAVALAPAGFVLLGIAWLAGRLWRGRFRPPLR